MNITSKNYFLGYLSIIPFILHFHYHSTKQNAKQTKIALDTDIALGHGAVSIVLQSVWCVAIIHIYAYM